MKGLWAVLGIGLIGEATAFAQERDRSLERIALALSAPPITTTAVMPDFPKKVGPLTLVSPRKKGEIVRVSLPIGEYVMKAARSVASAHERRKETAVRRRIAEELEELARRHR